MYKRKLPLDLSCGIRITMSVIGSKWKPCIIDSLREMPKRPSQIHREIPEAVSRVLDQNLRELEEHGVVKKNNFRRTSASKRIWTYRVGPKSFASHWFYGRVGRISPCSIRKHWIICWLSTILLIHFINYLFNTICKIILWIIFMYPAVRWCPTSHIWLTGWWISFLHNTKITTPFTTAVSTIQK